MLDISTSILISFEIFFFNKKVQTHNPLVVLDGCVM